MGQRHIKETENKGKRATMTIDVGMIETVTIKSEKSNVDYSIGSSEEQDTQKWHIPFLIFLLIGMILQVSGNTFCVLAGTFVCVSTCSLICIWVCFSAVFSDNESKSLSGTPEFVE